MLTDRRILDIVLAHGDDLDTACRELVSGANAEGGRDRSNFDSLGIERPCRKRGPGDQHHRSAGDQPAGGFDRTIVASCGAVGCDRLREHPVAQLDDEDRGGGDDHKPRNSKPYFSDVLTQREQRKIVRGVQQDRHDQRQSHIFGAPAQARSDQQRAHRKPVDAVAGDGGDRPQRRDHFPAAGRNDEEEVLEGGKAERDGKRQHEKVLQTAYVDVLFGEADEDEELDRFFRERCEQDRCDAGLRDRAGPLQRQEIAERQFNRERRQRAHRADQKRIPGRFRLPAAARLGDPVGQEDQRRGNRGQQDDEFHQWPALGPMVAPRMTRASRAA